jgi:PKHD-type hydroxylase
MVYNKLINFALSRSFLTHNSIRVESAFSKEEVDLIVASLRDGEKEQGQIGTIEAEAETLLKFRSSRVSFINYSKEYSWLFNKFNKIIQNVNEEYYNFDLNGYDFVQYSEYLANEKGHYDYHIDLMMDMIPQKDYDFLYRKLSFSLCLNQQGADYSGGDFKIKTGAEEVSMKLNKGDMLVFPSFILHKVEPVTEGVRKSLVGWVTGPKFK